MYLIAHNPQEPVLWTHNYIVSAIVERFGVRDVRTSNVPHITLKAPFEATNEQIESVKATLKDFAVSHRPSTILIYGFGHFDRDVIYMNARPSPVTTKTIDELMEMLKQKHLWMSFAKHDIPKKLHATLAKQDIDSQFEAIYTFVRDRKIEFEISFNTITLLEKIAGRWTKIQDYHLES